MNNNDEHAYKILIRCDNEPTIQKLMNNLIKLDKDALDDCNY